MNGHSNYEFHTGKFSSFLRINKTDPNVQYTSCALTAIHSVRPESLALSNHLYDYELYLWVYISIILVNSLAAFKTGTFLRPTKHTILLSSGLTDSVLSWSGLCCSVSIFKAIHIPDLGAIFLWSITNLNSLVRKINSTIILNVVGVQAIRYP